MIEEFGTAWTGVEEKLLSSIISRKKFMKYWETLLMSLQTFDYDRNTNVVRLGVFTESQLGSALSRLRRKLKDPAGSHPSVIPDRTEARRMIAKSAIVQKKAIEVSGGTGRAGRKPTLGYQLRPSLLYYIPKNLFGYAGFGTDERARSVFLYLAAMKFDQRLLDLSYRIHALTLKITAPGQLDELQSQRDRVVKSAEMLMHGWSPSLDVAYLDNLGEGSPPSHSIAYASICLLAGFLSKEKAERKGITTEEGYLNDLANWSEKHGSKPLGDDTLAYEKTGDQPDRNFDWTWDELPCPECIKQGKQTIIRVLCPVEGKPVMCPKAGDVHPAKPILFWYKDKG